MFLPLSTSRCVSFQRLVFSVRLFQLSRKMYALKTCICTKRRLSTKIISNQLENEIKKISILQLLRNCYKSTKQDLFQTTIQFEKLSCTDKLVLPHKTVEQARDFLSFHNLTRYLKILSSSDTNTFWQLCIIVSHMFACNWNNNTPRDLSN